MRQAKRHALPEVNTNHSQSSAQACASQPRHRPGQQSPTPDKKRLKPPRQQRLSKLRTLTLMPRHHHHIAQSLPNQHSTSLSKPQQIKSQKQGRARPKAQPSPKPYPGNGEADLKPKPAKSQRRAPRGQSQRRARARAQNSKKPVQSRQSSAVPRHLTTSMDHHARRK